MALIFTIIVGVGMLSAVMVVGWCRKLRKGIPDGGDCSAVIAATCQLVGSEREGVELGRVRWGVVGGVCGFSGREEVEFPEVGKVYA